MGIPTREKALAGRVAVVRGRRQEDRIARAHWDRVYQETPLEDIPWDEGQPSAILAQDGFQVAGIQP